MDKELVKELRGYGLTYQKIGDMFGVSRQRIYQIAKGIKTKRTPWTREKRLAYTRNNILTMGGKSLKVKKRPYTDGICELCGEIVNRLYYHHWDDNDPGKGIWVCQPCHWFVDGIERGYIESGLHNKYLELKLSIG